MEFVYMVYTFLYVLCMWSQADGSCRETP